jgi:VWFA-related protein
MFPRIARNVFGLAALAAPLAGFAQTTPPAPPPDKPAAQVTPAAGAGQTPTMSVTANLVNLPVTVRDKKGALVTNLTKADFTLSVDGHAQTIRYFDRDQNLPLTVGLLVDVSQSQRTVLDEEESASSTFLDQMLTTPTDRAFLVQFAREVELLQDLTNSRPKLQAGIKELGTPNPNERQHNDDEDNNSSNGSGNGNGNGNGNNGGYQRHGGTTLYDAVYLSSNELLKKQQGRKAIVILSDGVDRNSKETLNAAIEAAQRADTIVYAIYFKGEEHHDNGGGFPGGRSGGGYPGGGGGYPGGGGGYPGGGYPGGGRNGGSRGGQQPVNDIDGKRILQQIVDETGGRLFEAKKGRIADDFSQIAEELRSQYRLGYTPDSTITGEGYHQVDLKIATQKNLKVQTRDGYYTGK